MSKKITIKAAWRPLADRRGFNAGSLTAGWYGAATAKGWPMDYGRLSQTDADKFRFALGRADSTDRGLYVVFSYGTPIAWLLRKPNSTEAGWQDSIVTPTTKYSVTTSRHQHFVWAMLEDPNTFTPVYEHAERMSASGRATRERRQMFSTGYDEGSYQGEETDEDRETLAPALLSEEDNERLSRVVGKLSPE